MLPKIKMNTQIEFADYPTNTFYVDPISKQIRGFADGLMAMKQAVEIILQVERYKFQVYTSNVGVEFDGLIGINSDYIVSELKRRIDDAFVPDRRIKATKDYTFDKTESDTLAVSFVVETVYGNFTTEVDLNSD